MCQQDIIVYWECIVHKKSNHVDGIEAIVLFHPQETVVFEAKVLDLFMLGPHFTVIEWDL